MLELVEHEEGSCDETAEGYCVVPVEFVTEVEDREDSEDAEGDDLLDDFELVWSEGFGPDAIGWYLKAVLEEGDAPTDEDYLPECDFAVLEMTIPSEGHEDVGADQQQNRPHVRCFLLMVVNVRCRKHVHYR
jgi:hypothetical protein